MAEQETITNPETSQDNSDLEVTTEPKENQAPTDTQVVPKTEPSKWTEGLDPELKDHPSLKNFKSPADLAKSWVNAQKLIGKDKVVIPGEKATQEERDAFYNKLGRPEKAEGYKFEPLPEPVQDADGEKDFAATAHKIGLTAAQAQEIHKWYGERVNQQLSQMNENTAEQAKETETGLRKEWGMAYNSKMQSANKVLATAPDDVKKDILEKLGNHPGAIKWLATLGGKFSEAGIVGHSPDGMMSPEEAQAEIAKLKSNPAYLDGQHPEHKLVVSRMTQLFQMLHPE